MEDGPAAPTLQKTKKNILTEGDAVLLGPPRRSLGGAETQRQFVILQTVQKVAFKEKTRKSENREGTADPGTQNGTVPKGTDK